MRLLLLLSLTFTCALCVVEDLPAFNVDKTKLTVSGISAGAYFASQFHIAYSSVINGCGSWAGGPNLCYAKYNLMCMFSASIIDVDALIADTEELESRGDIDLTINMANHRVYLVHGTKDATVAPASSVKMREYYSNYITNPDNIVLKNDLDASHAVISDHAGTNCGRSDNRLYIENCDFDSITAMMDHVLGGGVNPPLAPGTMTGRLVEYDQEEFFGGNANGASMDATGFVYIPPSCESGSVIQCRFHIFFHGCTMDANAIGTDFITESGFIELADANNIVILFPQNKRSLLGGNPNGCFNWFGYLGDLTRGAYAAKDAEQMAGIYAMLERAADL